MPAVPTPRAVLAAVVTLPILAYAPAVFFSFGFHNDYWAWGFDANWCCGPHPEAAITAAIGRILAAWLLTAQFLLIHSLEDLAIWRGVTIATLALNCLYLFHLLRREAPGAGHGPAAAATLLVFLHKTMQLNVLWASNLVYFNVPILLALAGAHLLLLAREGRQRPAVAVALHGLALVPLVTALFIYPPSATFLIVPPLYGLLMRRPDLFDSLRTAAVLALLLAAGFALYAGIHRHLVLPSLPEGVSMSTYRWELPPQPLRTALSRLLRFYLPDAANGWTIWTAKAPGFALLAAILLGLGWSVWRHWRAGRPAVALAEVVAVGALFALASLAILPNLVAEQFATSVRVLFVPGASLGIGLCWVAVRLLPPRAAMRVLAGSVAVAGCLACAGVLTTARLAEREHEAIGAALAPLDRSMRQDIVVLRSNAPRRFLGLEVNEAFRPLPPIVLIGDAFLGRRHRGEARFDLSIVSTQAGQPPIFVESATTVIDLQPMREEEATDRPVRFGVIGGRITVTPPGAAKGVADAFDGSNATFWEAWTTPFPIAVRIDFTSPRAPGGYRLAAGLHERSDRMPTGWEVYASADGNDWTPLDRQVAADWRDGEVRRYALPAGGPWVALRFDFTANGLPPGGTEGVRVYEIGFD